MTTFNTILPQLTAQLQTTSTPAEIKQIDEKAQRVIAYARSQPVFNQKHEGLITRYTAALSKAMSRTPQPPTAGVTEVQPKQTQGPSTTTKVIWVATTVLLLAANYYWAAHQISSLNEQRELSSNRASELSSSSWGSCSTKCQGIVDKHYTKIGKWSSREYDKYLKNCLNQCYNSEYVPCEAPKLIDMSPVGFIAHNMINFGKWALKNTQSYLPL